MKALRLIKTDTASVKRCENCAAWAAHTQRAELREVALALRVQRLESALQRAGLPLPADHGGDPA